MTVLAEWRARHCGRALNSLLVETSILKLPQDSDQSFGLPARSESPPLRHLAARHVVHRATWLVAALGTAHFVSPRARPGSPLSISRPRL